MIERGVHLPAWDLRGCHQPARTAIIASQIRKQVFSRLKERHMDLTCLTLSQLALIYDQARWWITHQEQAEDCLSCLLSLRSQALQWRQMGGQASQEAEEEGGDQCQGT